MDSVTDVDRLFELLLLGYARAYMSMDAKASWIMAENMKGPMRALDRALNSRELSEELQPQEDEPEPNYPRWTPEYNSGDKAAGLGQGRPSIISQGVKRCG